MFFCLGGFDWIEIIPFFAYELLVKNWLMNMKNKTLTFLLVLIVAGAGVQIWIRWEQVGDTAAVKPVNERVDTVNKEGALSISQ